MLGQAQTTRSSVRSLTPCPPEFSMFTGIDSEAKLKYEFVILRYYMCNTVAKIIWGKKLAVGGFSLMKL